MKIYGGELIPSGSTITLPVTALATTGSNTFNGNQTVNGEVTITGNLTAQQYIVSSSVMYLTESFSSGSHKFGDTIDDVHTVTGSLNVTGSQTINGTLGVSIGGSTELSVQQTGVILGNLITDTHRVTGSFNVSGSITSTSSVQATQVNVGTTGTATSLASIQSPYGILSGLIEANVAGNAYYNSGWKYYGNGPTGVFNIDTSGNFGFYTAASGTSNNNISLGNAKVTITNSGDLLVGTTSSSYSSTGRGLIVANGTTNSLYGWSVSGTSKGYMYHEGTNVYLENSVSGGNFNITQVGAGNVTFTTNGVERMRLLSAGGLLLGATINLSTGAGTQSMVIRNGTSGQGLYFASVLNTADQYVPIGTQYDTTNGNNRAEMRFAIDGSDTNTRISFHTANGAGTLSERMRITSAGRIIVNNSVANDSGDRNITIQGSLSATNNDIASLNLTQVWNGTSYPVILAAQQDLTYGNASGAFVLKTSYWNGSSVTTGERLRITATGVVQPGANGTQDLGTSSLRWATIYTSDLSLSNGIGDYTIVEGEEKLYLYNNKNNKVYSFVLHEEDPATATPKKS